MLFDAARPVILNGIEDIVTRPDLADRAVLMTLEPIPEERRRPEQEFWAAFEAERPHILGVLLDAVAKGLAMLPQTRLDKLPRMADFALWATACETALWPAGTFWSAYCGNRDEAVEGVIDADPVAAAVRAMMQPRTERTVWTGNATDLLGALSEVVGERTAKSKSWPENPRALSGRLRRAATFLRKTHDLVACDGVIGCSGPSLTRSGLSFRSALLGAPSIVDQLFAFFLQLALGVHKHLKVVLIVRPVRTPRIESAGENFALVAAAVVPPFFVEETVKSVTFALVAWLPLVNDAGYFRDQIVTDQPLDPIFVDPPRQIAENVVRHRRHRKTVEERRTLVVGRLLIGRRDRHLIFLFGRAQGGDGGSALDQELVIKRLLSGGLVLSRGLTLPPDVFTLILRLGFACEGHPARPLGLPRVYLILVTGSHKGPPTAIRIQGRWLASIAPAARTPVFARLGRAWVLPSRHLLQLRLLAQSVRAPLAFKTQFPPRRLDVFGSRSGQRSARAIRSPSFSRLIDSNAARRASSSLRRPPKGGRHFDLDRTFASPTKEFRIEAEDMAGKTFSGVRPATRDAPEAHGRTP